MHKSLFTCLLICLVLGAASCNQFTEQHWTRGIPAKSPVVIVPEPGLSPQQILGKEYIPFVDDITSSSIQLISEIEDRAEGTIGLHALTLYPGTAHQLQPIWMLQAPEGKAAELNRLFYREFTQNKYRFKGQVIYKLHVRDQVVFAAQLHGLLLLSESSLGLEDAIRSYLGETEPIAIDESGLTAPTLILNTPSLDYWMEQVAQVQYIPSIKGSLNGTGPAYIDLTKLESGEQKKEYRLTGNIPLNSEERSELVNAISSEMAPVTLDRYISSNTSSFGIFRLAPRMAPPTSLPDTTDLDQHFFTNPGSYSTIAQLLEPEFALVTYTESGFLSAGEHLFLRKLNDRRTFLNRLDQLVEDDLLRKIDSDTYYAQGAALASLIGSELCSYTDFYLDITGEVVVISKRRGLAEIVESDRNRRRVIYYESDYTSVRNNLPAEVSAFIYAGPDFYEYISSFLGPDGYVNAITSQFNQLSVSFQLREEGNSLAMDMHTYSREQSDIPYEEQWFFPTGGAAISGKPVFADIRGSAREEIIFATETGTVYALASDGTTVMQTNTGGDQPIGSPVVYDWYGTNQQIIMLAAGNKIYAWNESGTSLPKFPFSLNERITTPLLVYDIDKNGLPEAIVATANRELHALEGRGNNIEGWPATTNAVIRSQPVVEHFRGDLSILAFSENALHGWRGDGTLLGGFPIFVNASLNGSPVVHEGNVLGSAADGYLYSMGGSGIFPDSVNIYSNQEASGNFEAVYVSNSPLIGTPSVHTLSMRPAAGADENLQEGNSPLIREPIILTMSSNGSIFLINEMGQLRMTQNMGQPANQNFSPLISDINGDGSDEIIALANFGRLYAWQVINGNRIYELPTSGMNYPVITDLDGDGNKELIAQTNEGLRSWTIYGE